LVVRHKLVILGILFVAASAMSVVPASAAQSSGGRHVLPGTKPDWTSAARQSDSLPAGQRVSAKVWLSPRNAAQLDALAQAVSDPASSQYANYLTAAQYDQQFAPSAGDVAAVRQWLTSDGLHIDAVGAGNTYLAISGSAAAINSAFTTQLAHYEVNGKQEQAPSQDVSVPDAVAGTVLAVTGLSTLGHLTTPADLGAPAGFANATPCSSYYGQKTASSLPKFNGQTLPYDPCGYTPSQLRSVYGVGQSGGQSQSDGGLGRGQTVAITDAFDSSRLLKDANTYATRRGDSAFGPGQFSDRSVAEVPQYDANGNEVCQGNSWYGEQSLDVEAVHGMAPKANVLYYGAASCQDADLLAQLARVVHDNKASIVTNSWGEPTFVVIGGTLYTTIDQSLINAYESVFKHGAVQGIGFYFSSGDNGDELAAWGYKHPDWPTGDPWVTSVGGTALAIDHNGQRAFETGWGTAQYRLNSSGAWGVVAPFQYGAGGGFSQIFPEPKYQKGVVKNDPTGGRAVPDIGLDADPTTGMLIGITQNFPLSTAFGAAGVHYGEYRVGGTSLSSPLLAGIQADAQPGRSRIGFANPLIYSLARGEHNVYYDVTPQGDQGNVRSDFNNNLNASAGLHYSVRTFNQDSSLTTGKGWDDVTGVGAVTARYIQAVSGHQ
jgi:subtilase family serine protease